MFQLEAKVSTSKQTTEHLEGELVELTEILEQEKCRLFEAKDVSNIIARKYKEIACEIAKERNSIAEIKEISQSSEGTKRGKNGDLTYVITKNKSDIVCKKNLLKKETKQLTSAQHDQLCSEA